MSARCASGLSTPGGCSAAAFEKLASPAPADTVVADFTASIPSALGADENVGILTFNATSFTFVLSCDIPAGDTSCTAAGPSGTLSAGTLIVAGAVNGTATQVSFGYRLATPGVTLAAAKPQQNTMRYRFKS